MFDIHSEFYNRKLFCYMQIFVFKMAISKFIKWLFVIMLLCRDCSADNITRNVCLETAFVFALGDKACQFTLAGARQYFDSDTGICLQKCLVKINDLEENSGWLFVDTPEYRLTSITLSINDLSKDLKMKKCTYEYPIRKILEIICKTDSENVDTSKDLCLSPKDCVDVSMTCSPPLIGQIGVCVCKPGYIGFGNKCLQGNLKLNGTCKHNEQCSAVFGSVCQNDKCVCKSGYAPLNDSECALAHTGGISEASVRGQKEDNVVSVTVGSVFGGLILGIILTVLTITIYHHIRHGKPNAKERDCPNVASFNNTTYETEIGKPQRIPAVHPANDRKVVNVPPFAHSVELQVNRNTQEATKRSMANNDVNDDVYNHLHEKQEDADIDENYDHAQRNPNHASGESNYSNLNTRGRSREPGASASEDDDYNVLEPTSDYYSLKKQ